MRVYTNDGRARGPADLDNYTGPLLIEGAPPEHSFGAWANAIGCAVLRGCDVRRKDVTP